jgi:DNA replicative helicase MCM subunit Mcm2 (Cdc46/Mcm family)
MKTENLDNSDRRKIRSKINSLLDKYGKYKEDRLVSYVASELGYTLQDVREVLEDEIKDGDIYYEHDDVISLTV